MNIEPDRPSSDTLEITVTQRHMSWFIEIQDDAGARRMPLGTERVVVGTAPDCDLVLRDPTVSGHHCALAVLGSGVAIEDLGSTNGTFVGNARVPQAWGTAGTTVSIGRSSLVVMPAAGPATDSGDSPLPNLAGGLQDVSFFAGDLQMHAGAAVAVGQH